MPLKAVHYVDVQVLASTHCKVCFCVALDCYLNSLSHHCPLDQQIFFITNGRVLRISPCIFGLTSLSFERVSCVEVAWKPAEFNDTAAMRDRC